MLQNEDYFKLIRQMVYRYAGNTELINCEGVDWNYFYKLCKRHKLFYLYKTISENVPDKYKGKFENKYLSMINFNTIMLEELKRIQKLCTENNVRLFLLKGFAFAHLLNDSILTRHQFDMDVLVPIYDLNAMQQMLEQFGYVCAFKNIYFNKECLPAGLRVMHYNFHECEYRKSLELNTELTVEIHITGAAIPEHLIGNFIDSGIKTKLDNILFNTFDLLHTFLYLCANTYGNFELWFGAHHNTYIRDIADIYIFAERHLSELDIEEVCELGNKYKLLHKVLCVFNLLKSFCLDTKFDSYIERFEGSIRYDTKCYSKGQFVDWELSLFERLFFDAFRIDSYNKMYYQRCLSTFNLNYQDKIILPPRCQSAGICFENNEFGYKINCSFKITCVGFLEISFSFSQDYFLHRPNLELVFSWLKNYNISWASYENPMNYIFIYKDGSASFQARTSTDNILPVIQEITKDELTVQLAFHLAS